ncbi:zinc finger CCCH domain-containing protein 4 [Selaginella moellendorffii]|uniref:zinc finger CCCH domain-containing protein 4 n=1 Tax=Selaginella moellendorffii TaxID=88036 RepID=UPI000D1C3D4B|nr:zinc finger CCCH domain-containing protein 4 [Selaginella moellendorffii]|eukprot:XP_024533691.1 zinc finger CCCH domain-containing protein 4 [Selaginella moellendorffii]
MADDGEGLRSRRLPVRRLKATIVQKVEMNRVTIILAETGSGKSSQVPQMLLEEGFVPILCTQPRRFAVVAVSKMVAEERGCELGQEVGFHIGQMNRTSSSSKIVFQTAGVLLEEIKSKGVAALSHYKVVILDEIHEGLVLMSELGETAVSNLASKIQQHLFQCSVKYLDQVVQQLGNKKEHLSVMNSLEQNPSPFKNGTDIGMEIQHLIFDLIAHIHKDEPDRRKGILVFLPTYRALEEQWSLLTQRALDVEIFVLHSSIDIDQSLEAIEAYHSVRKVILATDVAESSITIPGASFVIDSCRCLEVFWNSKMKRDGPRIVWELNSQAEQRKGRTGRTCDGTVFRMMPRTMYATYNKFEVPAMQLLSLRKQVLSLFCAEARALNDALAFFDKCMNPPHPDTVYDALESLEALNALQRDAGGKKLPTPYGRILASLPLSLEASMLVMEGCERGYLNECAVIASVLDTTPSPIILPFGASATAHYSFQYFQESQNGIRQSRQAALLGNLCAFEFWQCVLKIVTIHGEESEKEFCKQHHLSLFSLNAVAELYDDSCLGLPYVSNGSFHNENNQSDLLKIIVETQARYLEPQSNYKSIHFPKEEDGEVQCVYFRRGFCAKGNCCEFSHSVSSTPAVCKFFLSGDGCRYGAHCRYKHDSDVPRWDNRLEFDEDVAQFPTVLCSSTRNLEGTMLVFGREALSYIHQLQDLPTASIAVACNEDSQLEAEKSISDSDQHKAFFQEIFHFLAVTQRKLNLFHSGLVVLLTMTNIEFWQCQVERAGRENFLFLQSSTAVDPAFFKGSSIRPPVKLVTYIFKLVFPRRNCFTSSMVEVIETSNTSRCFHRSRKEKKRTHVPCSGVIFGNIVYELDRNVDIRIDIMDYISPASDVRPSSNGSNLDVCSDLLACIGGQRVVLWPLNQLQVAHGCSRHRFWSVSLVRLITVTSSKMSFKNTRDR